MLKRFNVQRFERFKPINLLRRAGIDPFFNPAQFSRREAVGMAVTLKLNEQTFVGVAGNNGRA
jgi:hypothetical protein